MASKLNARALHYVFKVADRTISAKFYREVLGMRVLRHEEFTEGCEAGCNGNVLMEIIHPAQTRPSSRPYTTIAFLEDVHHPFSLHGPTSGGDSSLRRPYDNRWSKTMVGYGFEDTHFVIELTYNYNVHSYDNGNEFLGITIKSREVIARAKATRWPLIQEDDRFYSLEDPNGYKFFIIDEPQPEETDPMQKLSLGCTSLDETINYYHCELGMKLLQKDDQSAVLAYGEDQVKLQFIQIGELLVRGTGYGRTAFAISGIDLRPLEKRMKDKNLKILTPLVTLITPGKASVTVVILGDPDGHEICFVDEENYMLLSQFDPQGEVLLNRYIKKDAERKTVWYS